MIPLISFIVLCIIIIVLVWIIKYLYNNNFDLKEVAELEKINTAMEEDHKDFIMPLPRKKDNERDKTLVERTRRYQSNGKGFNEISQK